MLAMVGRKSKPAVERKEMGIKMREIKALVYSDQKINHPWNRWRYR